MYQHLSFGTALVLVGLASSAQGAFLITVGDRELLPGQTGFVDVRIRSDQAGGEPLSAFGVEFLIAPIGPIGTRLEFVVPQPDPQLSDPGYVFFGNSFAEDFAVPIGAVDSFFSFHDRFIGGDSTADSLDMTIFPSDDGDPNTDMLLARLQITAITALPPVAGDAFALSLVAGPNTTFLDSSLNEIAFSSTAGTVTISAAPRAVPEPSALAVFAGGAIALFFGHRLRRIRWR